MAFESRRTTMPRKRHKPEEIVAKLRQVDVLESQGQSIAEAVRSIGVTEVTYYRWRQEFGGLKSDQVKRLKDLETENTRLRRAIADLTLDKLILQEAAGLPGVGPVVALTYRACVDNPARFSRSKCVGAHYGLTPRLYQSGETARIRRVSKCGDSMMRAALYEAALVLLTGSRGRWSTLKAWGIGVAKRRGMQKAIVAVARQPPIVLHPMLRGGTGI